jgi:hypothetical protein
VIPLLLDNTGTTVYTPLTYFFVALATAAFVMEAWALGDAVLRPASAFISEGKQNKRLWLILLGAAAVVGLFGFLYGASVLSGNFLSTVFIAAFVVSAVYMADVRPKVKGYRRGKTTSSGPYGGW